MVLFVIFHICLFHLVLPIVHTSHAKDRYPLAKSGKKNCVLIMSLFYIICKEYFKITLFFYIFYHLMKLFFSAYAQILTPIYVK